MHSQPSAMVIRIDVAALAARCMAASAHTARVPVNHMNEACDALCFENESPAMSCCRCAGARSSYQSRALEWMRLARIALEAITRAASRCAAIVASWVSVPRWYVSRKRKNGPAHVAALTRSMPRGAPTRRRAAWRSRSRSDAGARRQTFARSSIRRISSPLKRSSMAETWMATAFKRDHWRRASALLSRRLHAGGRTRAALSGRCQALTPSQCVIPL